MFDLTVLDWTIVTISAIAIGFSKAGLPNLIIFVVTLMMIVFPAKESVGILLPMLLVGDLFAIIYYRRSVVWKHLLSLIPWSLLGIAFGYMVLIAIDSKQLEPLIGVIVLTMIGLHAIRSKFGERFNELLPDSRWFTSSMGTLGGFTTMIGNAAGGIMSIYLLVKGLPKKEFVGTSAWFFLTVNAIKFPLYMQLGLITGKSLAFNSMLIIPILLGALLGVKILPAIPQKIFQILILGLAAIGGINLLL
ncbi:sulfite exporter TauE/SafE family protein [Oceanobacillus piezotolerans]|uniref:Probable membrane transporter protein n=1 Tax=Oceanobacillus piezotolerans TaxID=2448030 RepID=A0A498DKC1_9BACI|nr:sulfite exporter TauE/SafE family protein [Oceanobacillus piezotolerans]RLL46932.1 sulfite exporter TauE/SafE family protein [Oceanobacillus piezotolerans]